ncbi:MAG: sulfatase [Bryobacterales bacterium]|nr:sulfatase [Bryobacterales bacterium]
MPLLSRRHLLAAPAFLRARSGTAADRPNVLWIIGDDLGVELSCYGRRDISTPNMDRLAAGGVRFQNCHTTSPVCSSSRSAFNVGLYQTTTGTHHHRSHRGDGHRLPAGARLITDRLREAGYFTCNVGEFAPGAKGTGKTDFNFVAERPFDGTHWNRRQKGQPFFAQVNFQDPHKGPAFVEARKQKVLVDPKRVELPPYYPDHPVVRDEVANYLDAVQLVDRKAGLLLDALRRDGALDNTVVFLFGDNGRCLLRGKQWLYEAGSHIPLLVSWPGVTRAGATRPDVCTALDVTATTLAAAGIRQPEGFHGQPLFGAGAAPREWIVTARDRCGEAIDRIRSVRDRRYRYIRNFMPERPYTQPSDYIARQYPTLGVLTNLHAAGKLDAVQSLFMVPRKPDVEFYDLQQDPHEVRNLAASRAHAGLMRQFAARLDQWMKETHDRGAIPETRDEYEKYRG